MDRVHGFEKRAPRIDLRRPAVLVDAAGGESSVIILDVSSGGFRLELTELPRIGELVTLRVEHGEEFAAQIRWALGDQAGGVFLAAVDHEHWRVEGSAMPNDGHDDRRTSDDRRKDDRRQEADRRQVPRDGDRRRGDRREGDRRG
jgi:hypothetical protein